MTFFKIRIYGIQTTSKNSAQSNRVSDFRAICVFFVSKGNPFLLLIYHMTMPVSTPFLPFKFHFILYPGKQLKNIKT